MEKWDDDALREFVRFFKIGYRELEPIIGVKKSKITLMVTGNKDIPPSIFAKLTELKVKKVQELLIEEELAYNKRVAVIKKFLE